MDRIISGSSDRRNLRRNRVQSASPHPTLRKVRPGLDGQLWQARNSAADAPLSIVSNLEFEDVTMLIIGNKRRDQMRTFKSEAVFHRRWTTAERSWILRAYMEKRSLICPVCDSSVVLNGDGTCLHCPGCGNTSNGR